MNGLMDILLPIVLWCVLILTLEGTLWMLFRRKFMQICLPVEGEKIFFHFFTVWRLRLLAGMHALVLMLCVSVAHLLLWS